ncbi:MAG TPA: S41 family peptidase [Bacteroidia bacterium]|jgi:carboxyl-terminal processing protease|nr:S41 family peptidase [Bacteroidia bacterium]
MQDNLTNNRRPWLNPLIYSALLIAGVIIGSLIFRERKPEKFTGNPHASAGKIDNVLDFIEQNYVDTVKRSDLEEKTLVAMLNQLDPHSEYIPAADLQQVNEPLQGNFDGIGVEFNIVNDTICVVHPVQGGPSESVGVKAGDRIVKVEGKNLAGVKISNKKVFEALRGKKGTKVKVSIKRAGVKELLDFIITRGEIPIYSIDAAFMAEPGVGYIKISRFAAATYEEFRKAFNKLSKAGMKKLILDLRGNGGGYLNAAVDIADEFLSKGMLIVYTQGKASPKKVFKASERGSFENNPLVVLIDEGSASASEIVSGALQDNDRAVIIGRRSFGKGLVQEQIEIPDGSALRLTTARYYTPSGRCIQKSYSKGLEAYYSEEFDRYENGEMLSADSIHFADSLKYKTVSGKTVYGGGGIMPDVFVPIDTSFRTSYLNKVSYKGIVSDFAFNYADKHRSEFSTYKTAADFVKNYNPPPSLLASFAEYAQKQGVEKNEAQLKKSMIYLTTQLKALIGRNLYDSDAYFPVILKDDKAFKAALQKLESK